MTWWSAGQAQLRILRTIHAIKVASRRVTRAFATAGLSPTSPGRPRRLYISPFCSMSGISHILRNYRQFTPFPLFFGNFTVFFGGEGRGVVGPRMWKFKVDPPPPGPIGSGSQEGNSGIRHSPVHFAILFDEWRFPYSNEL